MSTYSLSRLSNGELGRGLLSAVTRDRAATAQVLAYIAEFDERRLFAPAGYPSMHAYCVQVLRMSEDVAGKRITGARVARAYPSIFTALAEGELHLSAVVLLAPHLTPENASDLLAAAAGKTRAEIELLLAHRFPKPDLPSSVRKLPEPRVVADLSAPGRTNSSMTKISLPEISFDGVGLAPMPPSEQAGRSEHVPQKKIISRVKPLAPQRFALQFTVGQETHDRLRRAQELLSHQVPSGDLAEVFDRALKLLVENLEKQKFAATDKRRSTPRAPRNPRTISAHVRRAVQARDQGQCTFVSEHGKRCQARKFLEFDHVQPVARGGEATITNLRLRCRAHNQYEADQIFGNGFMHRKRSSANQDLASQESIRSRAMNESEATSQLGSTALMRDGATDSLDQDILKCLRTLGCRAAESREALEVSRTIPNGSLEERVRLALCTLGPRAPMLLPAA